MRNLARPLVPLALAAALPCAAQQAVPEPTTLATLLIATTPLLTRRRRPQKVARATSP